jgi:hydrogenase maturation protease
MSRGLVVGLGNPLAGDDGFGPAVAGRLRDEGLGGEVTLVEACTDLLGLVDELERHETVVLVDAMTGGGAPAGTVALVDDAALLRGRARSTSAHRLSPVEAVRVFRALRPAAPTRIVLVALHVDEVGVGPARAGSDAVAAGARLVRAALRLPPS